MALSAAVAAEAYGPLAYPLPTIRIDPGRLRADLDRMEEALWTQQNRYPAKDGSDVPGWDGIALYSISGAVDDLRCASRRTRLTAAGEHCSYIREELLPQFGTRPLRVVFYRLKAGANIGTHRDLGENRVWRTAVRIHIPVITNDDVAMYLAKRRYHFPVGTAWYFDATAYHAVENKSREDRIHLVADMKGGRALERHLKPLTLEDRLRFARLSVTFYRELAETFVRYVRTPAGRQRIRARARILLGR